MELLGIGPEYQKVAISLAGSGYERSWQQCKTKNKKPHGEE